MIVRIIAIYNAYSPDYRVSENLEKLKKHCEVAGLKFESYSNKSQINIKQYTSNDGCEDLIVVLGGDGTLLGQIRKLAHLKIPFAGINCGNLGYLAEFATFDEFIREGLTETKYEDRELLNVRVSRSKVKFPLEVFSVIPTVNVVIPPVFEYEEVFSSLAVNDAVLTAGPPFRMIGFSVSVEPEQLISNYKADGVIVSSSLGSTAHNLSAGGPIISPNANVFCVTPIAPHTLNSRPTIISSKDVIVVQPHRVNDGTTLVVDGQEQFKIKMFDRIFVEKAKVNYSLMVNVKRTYWETLKQKMSE